MAGTFKPIPEGFHAVTPHLVVCGAEKAIAFYKEAFGAVERFRMPGPDGKLIMHAELLIGDSIVFLCDEFPGMEARAPAALNGTPVSIYLYVDDVDKVFERARKAGATTAMAVQDMFWGDRMGELVDPFGHRWSIASHVEDVPQEDLGRRAAEFFEAQGSGA